jgi:hypothetical protein
MSHNVSYTTADLELVKSKLSGILTRDPAAVGELIRHNHPDEVRPLVAAFNEATELLKSRQWIAPILGQLPPEAWARRSDGEMHVAPCTDTSLRFLALTPLEELAAEEYRQVKFREDFSNLLLTKIPRLVRAKYQPMLTWRRYDELGDVGIAQQPLASDIAFGHSLTFLERAMNECTFELEKRWLSANHWHVGESLPASVLRETSEEALEHAKQAVQRWIAKDVGQASEVPDNLIALTCANLAANRVLLEFTGLDALGADALEMIEVFLQELNTTGIVEVPSDMDGLIHEQAKDMLAMILEKWFGHGGLVQSLGGFFSRPMVRAEIELIVSWAVQVQDSYIAGRGHRGGPAHARSIHGSSHNLFIFALGIVAAFFGKTKVSNEFTGKKNPTHSIFPGRKAISDGNCKSPSVHALKLLEQAYSLIFFGNVERNVLSEGVAQRAETNSIRRAHLQQLIFFAVKNRSSSQLLALHNRIEQFGMACDEKLEAGT